MMTGTTTQDARSPGFAKNLEVTAHFEHAGRSATSYQSSPRLRYILIPASCGKPSISPVGRSTISCLMVTLAWGRHLGREAGSSLAPQRGRQDWLGEAKDSLV